MPLSLHPSSLAETDPRRVAITHFSSVLGLDSHFDGYRNLIERLIDLLVCLQAQGVPDSDQVKMYLEGFRIRQQESLEKKEGRLAPTGRAGNPMGTQFSRYPTPAFLLQPIPQELRNQAIGCQVLFLYALLFAPNHNLHPIATNLRKAFSPKSDLLVYLSTFPSLLEEQSDYFQRLQNFIAQQQVGESARSRKERELLRIFSRLLSHVPLMSGGHSKTPQTKTTPFETRSLKLPLGGSVTPYILGFQTSEGEAPETRTLFIAREDEAGDGTVSQSEDEVDAAARQTRRWLSRHEKLIPGDHGRFMPSERHRIARVLSDRLADDDRNMRVGAGILALSYLTGAVPKRVLEYPFGTDGEVTPSGTYVRRISRPADGYRPGSELEPQLAPSAEKVELSLPGIVADWLMRDAEASGHSLGVCLGVTLGSVSDVIEEILVELRDGGRFRRIRVERIASALAIELTLARDDPALTHLLAGTASQAPPVLAYYLAHRIDYLQHVYTDAVTRMMDVE